MNIIYIKRKRREGRKRLSLDMPTWLHDQIRMQAMNYHCTMTKWIMKAAVEKIKREM